MMIRVNGEFLEFDDDIEIERQVKLFEEINVNRGDFSYEFEIPITSNNHRILGIEDITETNKKLYSGIVAEIFSLDRELIYKGFLKVELNGDIISCSFFSGNSDWIQLISGKLKELNLNRYNKTINKSNITDIVTDGVIWPLMDTGIMSSRNGNVFSVDDFVPFIFVKTVIKEILQPLGIKLIGDILTDSLYNKLLVSTGRNEWFQDFVNARSCYVKLDSQVFNTSFSTIVWTNESYPRFDGLQNNYNESTGIYTADVKMTVAIELYVPSAKGVILFGNIRLFVNGVNVSTYPTSLNGYNWEKTSTSHEDGDFRFITLKLIDLTLNSGDYIYFQQNASSSVTVTNGWMKLKPTAFGDVYASSLLPDMEKIDFISSALSFFNPIVQYNSLNNTLSINLFKNIRHKKPIDFSNFVDKVEVRYFDLVDNYAKSNKFKWGESYIDEISDYNRRNIITYGSGEVNINNSFLQKEKYIIDSDFSISFDRNIPGIGNIICAYHPIIEANVGSDITISSVSNSGGYALFNTSGAHNLKIGNVARLKNLNDYSNDGVIRSVPSATSFTMEGVPFIANNSGLVNKLMLSTIDINDILLLTVYDSIENWSDSQDVYIVDDVGSTNYTSMNIGWFTKVVFGGKGSDYIKDSLSFGDINQIGRDKVINLLDRYFGDFKNVLSDPVVCLCVMYIPESIFKKIDYSVPITLAHKNANSVFYINRITGYKGSHLPCEVELIKLP
jgi:hypothetical protein